MKKVILLFVFVLVGVFSYGQKLKKGNLISIHVLTLDLKPNITVDQYIYCFESEFIPVYEKNFPGIKLYIAKGIRGQFTDSFSIVYLIKSLDVRDRYFPKPQEFTKLAMEGFAKVQPAIDELEKLGKAKWDFTDWEIQ